MIKVSRRKNIQRPRKEEEMVMKTLRFIYWYPKRLLLRQELSARMLISLISFAGCWKSTQLNVHQQKKQCSILGSQSVFTKLNELSFYIKD